MTAPEAGEHTELVARERKQGAFAGAAAILSVALGVIGMFIASSALNGTPSDAPEYLVSVHKNPGALMTGGAIQALGLALMIVPLLFLYSAAKARRPEIPKITVPLVIVGAIGLAIVGLVRDARVVDAAKAFSAVVPLPPHDAKVKADDLLRHASSGPALIGQLACGLVLGAGVISASIAAMRVGLLSRFMGVVGVILGVLYAIPFFGGGGFVGVFWTLAIGLLFTGRWPGGRGPAWDAGEAIPWPSAADRSETGKPPSLFGGRSRARAGSNGAAAPPETAPLPEPAPTSAPAGESPGQRRKKRKKKRR